MKVEAPAPGVIVSDLVSDVRAGAAALANGIFAHADETDDVHTSTTTHPGAAVVPAALAIGERNGLSGTDVLRAIALGYDVCGRHGRAMDLREMHRSGRAINNHSQTFGAAAAAGALDGVFQLRISASSCPTPPNRPLASRRSPAIPSTSRRRSAVDEPRRTALPPH